MSSMHIALHVKVPVILVRFLKKLEFSLHIFEKKNLGILNFMKNRPFEANSRFSQFFC